MSHKKSSYEDLQENIRDVVLPAMEVFRNKYEDRKYEVELKVPEFTCICPKTGLPDFGSIHIKYCPKEVCVELKSFKIYIIAFRSLGIFHENVVNRILDDFVDVCHPYWVRVEGILMPRGGITTKVAVEYNGKTKERG